MSVEFRLGHADHKVVEDFLTHHPAGVSAIVLDPKAARHQQHAAEAAREAGVDVIFDPATERLTGPGFDLPQLRSVTCTDNAGQRWLRRIPKGQAADSFVDWV